MANLSAEQVRDKFGLSYNDKHAGGSGNKYGADDSTGAIYSSAGDYIGTIDGFKRNDEGRKSKDGDGYLREDDGVMALEKIEKYAIKNGLGDARSNWNSINDVAGAVNDVLGGEASAPKEPFQERERSDDHNHARDEYDKHFENGNPWDTTSAVDSYGKAFQRATAAGREMTAGDYLRQRADDKKGGVARFTDYLVDKNTLASHESHHAAMNAISKAAHVGLKPPTLKDPGDMYDRYKADIDEIE